MGKVTELSAPGEQLTPPAPLSDLHDLSAFNCGKPTLDDWLRTRAGKSDGLFGRTYVVTLGKRVVGYYTLATGAEKREQTPGKLRRNSPEQIPLILLARLAVDTRFRGKGIGRGLVRDALTRSIQAAEIVGIRAVMVHAIDEEARKFYEKYGFIEFPSSSQTLYLPIDTMRRAL